MKKNITLFIRRLSLLLLFSMVTVGAMAVKPAYKTYPVFFPLADYPEFEYGTKLSTFIDPRATGTNKATSFSWSSNELGTAVWGNCGTGAYRTAPQASSAAYPNGRAISITCGYNRARYVNFTTPCLNPGTYRLYMGVAFDGGGTNRPGGNIYNIKLDNVFIQMSDSTTLSYFEKVNFGNRSLVNRVFVGGGNKQSSKYSGTATVKHYDVLMGTVTIPADTSGIHKLSFNLSNDGGVNYAFTNLQFIPVTETNVDADYDYPKFDNAGNTFFLADSLKTVSNTATPGYTLPYQVSDETVYTKFDVTLDGGLFFANKLVAVKRIEDKWTRVFVGTTDATGKIVANIPAGTYLVEVNKALNSKVITVTGNSSFYVGVPTGNVKVQYSAESWYVGKQVKVYNAGETVLLYDLTIPSTGIVPEFALPIDTLNAYKYYVKNLDGTTFDASTILIKNNSLITLDFQQTKYAVSINFGNDAFGNNQEFTVVRSTNANALYVSNVSTATGTYATQLPNGTYYLVTKSGYLFSTFVVKDAAVVVNVSARFATNFCLGKTVAGAKVSVYLASNKALLSTLTVGTDGKVSMLGMTNGRYYHNVYKVNGSDTTILVKKFTFMIEGADFTIGDASNLNQPYYLPYKVYFDIASGQPEITWGVSSTANFTAGSLKNVKWEDLPVDTIFNVKDTTWTYIPGVDTTFVVNYDSTSIKEIKYFDWQIGYYFQGVNLPSTQNNAYVRGDQFNFRLAPKKKLTFVTPILNPGRYNVYMSNRWKGSAYTPKVDTTYMDGKPLLVTDGKVRSFYDWGDGTTYRQFTSYAYQQAMHMGEALVTKTGTHELSLYSIVGSTGGLGQASQVWGGMIYFIPVDEDSVGINVTYYPRIDYTGRIIYRNASEGPTAAQTSMGIDGVNRPKYFAQFPDPSILSNADVDYTKKLTINGGIYSRGDVLTTISPVDKWTTKAVNADTLGFAAIALNPKAEPYSWAMDVEGIKGTAVVNDNKTIVIPLSISTTIASNYTITPNIDDPTIGTYSFNSTVKSESLPFYYPITGVVFYTNGGVDIKAAGDTLKMPKTEALNGIAPTYPTDLSIQDYILASRYSGNTTRLQPSNGAVVTVKSVKSVVGGIYPNPARETMNLKLNENAGVASFAIYNQLGQVVRRGSFTGTEHSASLSGVSKGMYMVNVKVNGKNWNTKLIVE